MKLPFGNKKKNESENLADTNTISSGSLSLYELEELRAKTQKMGEQDQERPIGEEHKGQDQVQDKGQGQKQGQGQGQDQGQAIGAGAWESLDATRGLDQNIGPLAGDTKPSATNIGAARGEGQEIGAARGQDQERPVGEEHKGPGQEMPGGKGFEDQEPGQYQGQYRGQYRGQTQPVKKRDGSERYGGRSSGAGSARRSKNSKRVKKDAPVRKRGLLDKIIGWLSDVLPMSSKDRIAINKQLLSAGMKMNPRRFYAISFLVLLGFSAVGLLLAVNLNSDLTVKLIYVVMAVFLGLRMPRAYLQKKAKQRQEEIARVLPNMLDLLAISVSAGMSFEVALQYIVERYPNALSSEFAIVQRDLDHGEGLIPALEDMAKRCDVLPLTLFVTAVKQSERFGASLSDTLSDQAVAIREMRKEELKEKANKLPVKMTMPTVAFILVAMFIIILAPAVFKVMDQLLAM